MEAVGTSVSTERMNNSEIKLNYLHSILSIVHSPVVLEATIKDMHLNITISNNIYDTFVELVNENYINIDKLISSLVNNNIACINKTLTFND